MGLISDLCSSCSFYVNLLVGSDVTGLIATHTLKSKLPELIYVWFSV